MAVVQGEGCETGLTDKLPLTGIVASLGAKAAGCSLLGSYSLIFMGCLLTRFTEQPS